MQGSSLCTLTLAPIEVRYRFDTAADLALLLDEFLISEALTGYREHNTSVTTLRTCVLQRMRDSGSLKAQTATMAIDHAPPVTIDCGAVSVLIPASRPKPGAFACTRWQQPTPTILSVHDVVTPGTVITLVPVCRLHVQDVLMVQVRGACCFQRPAALPLGICGHGSSFASRH